MKKLWLGRYIPTHSIYHSLDPRAKIIIMFLNVMMIIMISSWDQLFVGFLFMLCFLLLSKISLKFYLKQAMFLKYMYLFFIIFFTLTEGRQLLIHFGFINIYLDGFVQGLFYSGKMILFVLMGALLTFTTAPNEIVVGTKRLFNSLTAEKFAFMTSLAIRLIPMILDEVKLIYHAQQSRGLDFSEIPLMEKLHKLMAIIIPAISNTIKRLTMMMDVMDCRGYIVGEHRSSIYQLKWRANDTFYVSLAIIALISIILL